MSNRTKEELESDYQAIEQKLHDTEKKLKNSEYANSRYEDTLDQVTTEYTNSSEEYFFMVCVSELNNKTRSLTSELLMTYPYDDWKKFLMDSDEQKQLFNKIIESYMKFVEFSVQNVPQIVTCYYSPYSTTSGDDNRINNSPLQNQAMYTHFANIAVKLVYRNIFLSIFNMLSEDDREIVKQDEHKSATMNFIKSIFGKLCVKTIDVFLNNDCVDDLFFNLALLNIKTKNVSDNENKKYDYKKSLEGVFEKQIDFLITQCLFDDTVKEDFYKIILTYLNPQSNHYVENLVKYISCSNFHKKLKLYISVKSAESNIKFNSNNVYFLENIGNTTFSQLYNMGTSTQQELQNDLDDGIYCINKVKICYIFIDLGHSKNENNLLIKGQMDYRLFDCSYINNYEDYYMKIHDFHDEYRKVCKKLNTVNHKDFILDCKSDNESPTELFTYALDKFRYRIGQETSKMFFENIYNFVFKSFYLMLYTSKFKMVKDSLPMREFFAALRIITDNNQGQYDFDLNTSKKQLLLFKSDLNYDVYKDMTFPEIIYNDIVRIANDVINSQFNGVIEVTKKDKDEDETKEQYVKKMNSMFEHYINLIELFTSTFDIYDSGDLKPLHNTTKKLKLYY
ncbi:hypothetical protein PBI_SCTP2_264 [Salicola phage SCTP-2]|nr:hypothetical protein PBI_SCTP2_264 [Salicola phage SCTP-2]